MDKRPNDIASGAIVAAAQETLPEIFKLKVDHFEEICEYLDLDELMIFGQTCKHLRAVVGYIVQQTHPNDSICCTDKGLHIVDWKINGLSPYIQRMSIMGDNWHTIIESNRFNALKEMFFHHVSFTDDQIVCIKDILGKCEIIRMYGCNVNNEFFASFLVHCTSMKQLFIEGSSEIIIGTDNKWLLKQYPLLDRFVLVPNEQLSEVKELGTFFEKNPKIKRFSTDCNFLWSNKDLIKSAKIQLDVLTMIFIDSNQPRSSFYALLKELRDVGFYKQLKIYLYMDEIDQKDVTEMVPNAGLVKLCAFKVSRGIDLSPLIHLKELYLGDGCNGSFDLEKLATALVNLERLEFKMADRHYIYPFLRTSRKLKGIKVSLLLDGFFDPVDLLKMNKEREKLTHAGKVVIYVRDNVFLMNKWYNETCLSLVELKLIGSVDWIDDF